jgi:C1A family cysteine protease
MILNRDKKLKIVCSLVMLAATALMPSPGMSDLQAQDNETVQLAPTDSDFAKFLEEPPEPFCGYVPPPMDLRHLDAISVEGLLKSGALPDSFDWRDQGKVTPVKNQLPCATCWIFGTASVLESAVLIGENTTYDFSEQSVALCVDRSWVYLYDQPDEPCGISHGGGWSALAAEVLIRKGAVLESCNSYNSSGLQCNGACLCDNCTPVKKITGYRLVTNNQSQTSLIKQAIYDHGPVTMAYYDYGAHQYTDASYGTVYDCAACLFANHMVSIIGWDDSVPHFETAGTGAWLVKNSWGTDFGNNGYFWLAYNSSCMTEIAYLEYKDYDPNEHLYYWDEAGWVDDYGYEDLSPWMADIFTSTQDGSLTHVDFWTTSNNAQYDIYVYLDGDISNGLQNQVASQTGTCQELGYYSIPLTSPVSLTSGQPFTIAVKMTTPGYDDPIPVEAGSELADPPIQAGISYARSGDAGPWDDLASQGFNACLRARVRSEVELSILTTHLSDGVVGEAYEETMEAGGGVPPYIWEATGLSDGLNCSAAGVISGTPTENGDFTVTVTATDDAASSASKGLALKVHPTATTTAVTVEPASNKVGIGGTFTVDVFVDPGADIAGAQFNLSFDASVVTANGVTEGDLLSQGGASTLFTSGTIDNAAGTITNVVGAITTPGASVSASGTFATVSFAATAAGASALDLTNVLVANKQGQPLTITVADGSVTVCPDWDVNLDESVNVLDMTLVGQHWGESGAAHWVRGDVNRDGAINVLDMILIGQHWTG